MSAWPYCGIDIWYGHMMWSGFEMQTNGWANAGGSRPVAKGGILGPSPPLKWSAPLLNVPCWMPVVECPPLNVPRWVPPVECPPLNAPRWVPPAECPRWVPPAGILTTLAPTTYSRITKTSPTTPPRIAKTSPTTPLELLKLHRLPPLEFLKPHRLPPSNC